jgi:4-diphosphocytidyl-2-C-methyl-D-erythritol kinase
VSTPAFTVPSFAKINWSLRILGRRADGYHEVQTLLQTVSLRDELHFDSRSDSSVVVSCNDPLIPVDDSNLIIRAAHALRHHFQINRGANIRLEKRIPAKGGLGGASSNAAVALLALAQLWNLPITLTELLAIAAPLGSDVPFYLIGGCALATGTGTDLTSIPDHNGANTRLVIATPRATVATFDAYRALKAPALTSTSADSILFSSRADDILRADPSKLYNDFESVIFQAEPEIERVKNALNEAGAVGSLLAGSGSSVFGIFENEFSQARAAREMQSEIGWRIFPAVTISRQEYLQALGPCGSPLHRQ